MPRAAIVRRVVNLAYTVFLRVEASVRTSLLTVLCSVSHHQLLLLTLSSILPHSLYAILVVYQTICPYHLLFLTCAVLLLVKILILIKSMSLLLLFLVSMQ